MANKNNELNVDELLGSYESSNKTKEAKAAKQSTTDWAEVEDDDSGFGFAQGQKAAGKKVQKKKTTDKGWGELEVQNQAKTSDFTKIQEDEQKRKIIKKPGQAAKQTGVEFGTEYFPSLGEAPKTMPKRTEPIAAQPVQQTSNDGFTTVGPKRFTNTKKQGAGESFAPLDPKVVEKPVPVAPVREKPATTATTTTTTGSAPSTETVPTRGPGIFQRKADEPAEIPTDSKFKFGSTEGPRKFGTGSKISFKREEEKDDHEALRLQREREIEEKLQREREELARQRENREQKKHASGEGHEGHEGKRPMKFSNPKKEAEKQTPPQPEKVEEASTEPAQAKEHVEMHGVLSNKGWGEGPLLKKKK